MTTIFSTNSETKWLNDRFSSTNDFKYRRILIVTKVNIYINRAIYSTIEVYNSTIERLTSKDR